MLREDRQGLKWQSSQESLDLCKQESKRISFDTQKNAFNANEMRQVAL